MSAIPLTATLQDRDLTTHERPLGALTPVLVTAQLHWVTDEEHHIVTDEAHHIVFNYGYMAQPLELVTVLTDRHLTVERQQ